MNKALIFLPTAAALMFFLFWSQSAEERPEFPEGYEIAVWEWRSPLEFEARERQEMLAELAEHGVNRIYLNIEDYMNVMEGSANAREGSLGRFIASLDEFIIDAKAAGIEVEALAGAQEWARSSHRYIPPALLRFVIEYNDGREHGLSGIQFDIEYYNLGSFRGNEERETRTFLDLAKKLADEAVETVGDPDRLRLGFAVPYWFNSETRGSPSVTYAGTSKTPGEHLLDILENYGNSYVAIMSYRDRADGRGGTIDILESILSRLEERESAVKAIAGQETTDVVPARITHYGQSRGHLKRSVGEILSAYAENPALIGTAIHHAESFLEMEE